MYSNSAYSKNQFTRKESSLCFKKTTLPPLVAPYNGFSIFYIIYIYVKKSVRIFFYRKQIFIHLQWNNPPPFDIIYWRKFEAHKGGFINKFKRKKLYIDIFHRENIKYNIHRNFSYLSKTWNIMLLYTMVKTEN